MRSYVQQAHSLWQIMLHQVPRCLGKQDLSAVSSSHNACSVMHIQTDIAIRRTLQLTSVQTHAHPHHHTFRPGMGSEGTLDSHSRRDGISGASKGHKEGIPLHIDLVAMELEECGAQEVPTLVQEAGVSLTQLLKQARGPLNVGEE